MVDLATVQGRSTFRDRSTQYHDTTLPAQRETRVAPVAQTIDLRDAVRGNGQADEVRKVLGLGDQLTQAVVNYTNAKAGKQNLEDANRAVHDQATGTIDPELQKRSEAYSTAISVGRARNLLVTLDPEAKQIVAAKLARGASADPTKGEQPVTLEDVNHALDDYFKQHLVDENGKAIDYGTTAANTFLYQGVAKIRADILQNSMESIRGQEQDKAMSSLDDGLKLNLLHGQPADLEGYMQGAASLGVDPKHAKARLMGTLLAAAHMTENADLLNEAAASRRADGTPTWGTQEQVQLLESYDTLSRKFEAKHEKEAVEASGKTMGDIALRLREGFRLTPDYVRGLVDTHQLRPEDVNSLYALQDHQDALARQVKEDARSDQRWAMSLQEFAWNRESHAYEAQNRERADKLTGLMSRLYTSGASAGDGVRVAIAMHTSGELDDKGFAAMMHEVQQMGSDQQAVTRAGGDDYQHILNQVLLDAAQQVVGRDNQERFARNRAAAVVTFHRQIRKSGRPAEALKAALLVLGVSDKNARPRS